ncbi:MAG: sensor histidine kinase [Faecousia sp.]
MSQQLFYQSKESSMIEKCLLASDEISGLEVLNNNTISGIVSQLDSLTVTRLIVTDQSGTALYDSDNFCIGKLVLLPEVVSAIAGNNVFSWQYHAGAMNSRAATPIFYYGSIVGCVYMTEYDTSQGALIQLLQRSLLGITVILELVLVVFSVIYATSFSLRIQKIMNSMRIIQKGDYTHKVAVGGNDELTVLGNEFNYLTERLQTSEEKRSRFVSDASHELKTPLATIKLLSDSILQNDMDPNTVREFVEDIGNEAERLNRMTAKLLSLTRVDGERISESEIIYLAPTVRRVSKMLSPMASKAGIQLEMDLDGDAPVLILEDDLYQIVFNLMENGIKYNQPGGKLTISLHRTEDNAELTIRDTGMGIPPESLPHIFERFYRVDKARSRASGGSGLGLAIVRAIVQRNKGQIRVDSTVGKGSCFTVTFPVFDTEVDKE